jgi:hypothetical protein
MEFADFQKAHNISVAKLSNLAESVYANALKKLVLPK